jgi:beta-glucosidase
VTLESSIIYDESGDVAGAEYAGARSSDATVAKNALDDVTAGDGNMLEGYLSRNDIAGGMASIMEHTSDETPNEAVTDSLNEAFLVSGTDSVEYTFETYLKGEKTSVTETIYAHGANMMPFAETTPDGTAVSDLEDPLWDQVYYVVEGETTESGLPVVVDEEPTEGSYHKLTVADMADVPIDTEEGYEIWEKLTNETSIDEAIEIQGNSGWAIPAVSSVEKPKTTSLDGPAEPGGGFNGATWFAGAVAVASTWNKDIAYAEGISYGHQATLAGVSEAYAPAMNTHRSPFGGRNFEYFSEDGLIAGIIGGSEVSGILSTGVGVFVKHYALNDGDTNRQGVATWANEQAIREIYLVPFEITCKEYKADGIMGSMNRVGMSWFHYGLYKTITRDEWGWTGYLITDGEGAVGDAYNSAQAMLSVEGSMLTVMSYINLPATVEAYGDATSTIFGRYMLHNIMRDCLYQYAASVPEA